VKTSIGYSVLMAALVASGCRGWESDKTPVHLIHNMDTQEKGKAYRKDTTGLFADGRLMQAPPAGTVAQGQLDEDDQFHKGIDEKGEPTKLFPSSVKGDDGTPKTEVIARGKERYRIYCSPCHGVTGGGDGPVASKGLLVPPPAMHSERVKELTNGKVYQAMLLGVNNGNMSSYAAQIPVEDRWAIVSYVREMQRAKDSNQAWEPGGPAPVAEVKVATLEAGMALYKAKGCNACHSVDGSKIVGPTFKGIWGRQENTSVGPKTVDLAYVTESIRNPNAAVVEGYPPAMPAQNLTDLEIESLVKYFQTLN
jgi:mono/diheme cytochrome c family protein